MISDDTTGLLLATHEGALLLASAMFCVHAVGHITFWISLSLSPKFGLRESQTKDQSKREVVFRLDSSIR